MKKKTIISVVSNDLAGDQRVHKMALSLMEAGYHLVLAGRRFKNSPLLERSYRTVRFHLWFNTGPLFYAELNIRLFFWLVFAKADGFLSNDLDTLPAVSLAAWLRGIPFVLDSHEYFTEVPELINRPRVQKFWKQIERTLLPRANGVMTVNQAIADLFNSAYAVQAAVVMNLPMKEVSSRGTGMVHIPDQFENKHMIIYQGAVNVGRGLEEMIQAMPFLEDYCLVIAGNGDLLDDLRDLVQRKGLSQQVWFTGRLSFNDLRSLTCQATLGISLEQDLGLNYRLALPNKIFDYMQAGIPVLASNLPVMSAWIRREKTGEIVSAFDPGSLRDAVQSICQDPVKYNQFVEAAQQAANQYYWEAQQQTIQGFFDPLFPS